MKVIKNKQIIEDDWILLGDGHTIPSAGNIIVGLSHWNGEKDLLQQRAGKTAVVLGSDENPEDILQLDRLELIAIDFPKFSDGRGFSHARRLRERFGYKGELRAVGNVLRDQLFYMYRCGIDSYALQDGKDFQGALEAFDEFDVTYQAAVDDPRPLYRRVAR
ncbi:MAG: hypothetical protein RJA70_3733 [Pseudomonadota bacterium]|jgi:uncharacterized protein (DUF934 family)